MYVLYGCGVPRRLKSRRYRIEEVGNLVELHFPDLPLPERHKASQLGHIPICIDRRLFVKGNLHLFEAVMAASFAEPRGARFVFSPCSLFMCYSSASRNSDTWHGD